MGRVVDMQTVEEINNEYLEATKTAREKYAADCHAIELVYNSELVAVKERFERRLLEGVKKTLGAEDKFDREREREPIGSREVVTAMFALDDAEDDAAVIREEMRQAGSEVEARRQKALTPIKAEYGRATSKAQRKRWEKLSRRAAR